MALSLKLTGIDNIQDMLAELPKATNKNVVRRAMMDAAEPMAEHAADLAPVLGGDLSEGITVTTQIVKSQADDTRRPGKDEVRAFVGANYRPGTDGYAPHAHLVEFGTGERQHKSGKSVGQMPAQPFMRPAFDGGKDTFISRFSTALLEQVNKAVARFRRKKARGG